jgi:hypothetical protein
MSSSRIRGFPTTRAISKSSETHSTREAVVDVGTMPPTCLEELGDFVLFFVPRYGLRGWLRGRTDENGINQYAVAYRSERPLAEAELTQLSQAVKRSLGEAWTLVPIPHGRLFIRFDDESWDAADNLKNAVLGALRTLEGFRAEVGTVSVEWHIAAYPEHRSPAPQPSAYRTHIGEPEENGINHDNKCEIATSSRRCSREVGRFMRALDSGEPLPDDILRWWLDRY